MGHVRQHCGLILWGSTVRFYLWARIVGQYHGAVLWDSIVGQNCGAVLLGSILSQ